MRSYSHKNQNKNKRSNTNKNKRRNSYKNKRKNTYKNKKGQNGGAFGKGKTKKRLAALERVVKTNRENIRELAKQVRGILSLPGVRMASRGYSFNANSVKRRL